MSLLCLSWSFQFTSSNLNCKLLDFLRFLHSRVVLFCLRPYLAGFHVFCIIDSLPNFVGVNPSVDFWESLHVRLIFWSNVCLKICVPFFSIIGPVAISVTTILAPSVAIENSGTIWTIDPCHVTCFVFLEAFAIFPSIFFLFVVFLLRSLNLKSQTRILKF